MEVFEIEIRHSQVNLVLHQPCFDFLLSAEITVGDRKVVEIGESIEKNQKIGHIYQSQHARRPKRILDTRVAEGFDMPLVSSASLCLICLCGWLILFYRQRWLLYLCLIFIVRIIG